MLHLNPRATLDRTAELIGLVVFIAVCWGVFALLAPIAALVRPVLQ